MPCAHEMCSCEETEIRTADGTFCCPACAAAPAREWTSCRCPHPDCRRTGKFAGSREPRSFLDVGPTDSGPCAGPMPGGSADAS